MMLENIPWRKPSACGDAGSCVEVAFAGGQALVRDSKLGDESPVLKLNAMAFESVIGAIKNFPNIEATWGVWALFYDFGLRFDEAEKTTFITAVRAGEYDNLLGGAR